MFKSTEMGWPASIDGRDGTLFYDSKDSDDENQEPRILSQEVFITQLPYQSLRAESPRQPLATKPMFNLNDNALAQQLLASSFDTFGKPSIAAAESSIRRGDPGATLSKDESPTSHSSRNKDITRGRRRSEVVQTKKLSSDLSIATSQKNDNSAEQTHSRGPRTADLNVETHFLAAEGRQRHVKRTGNTSKRDLDDLDSVAVNLHSSLEPNDQIAIAESSLWRTRTARGRYVPRYAKMIAKKQQAILDQQEDGWQPPYAGKAFHSGDVPIELLNLMTQLADDTAEAAANLQKETWVNESTSKEDPEAHLKLEPAEFAPAARHPPSPAMQSSPPSSALVSWSSSEHGSQQKPLRTWRELPPDSSPLKSETTVADFNHKPFHNNGSVVNDLISSVTFTDVEEGRSPEQDSRSEDDDNNEASVSDVDKDREGSKTVPPKPQPSTDVKNADKVNQESNSNLAPARVISSADSSKVVQVSRTRYLRKACSNIVQGSGEVPTMAETNVTEDQSPHLEDLPNRFAQSPLIIPATAFGPGSTKPLALPMFVSPALPRPAHSELDAFEHDWSEDELIYRSEPGADDEVLSTGHKRSTDLPFASMQDLHSQPEQLFSKEPPRGTPNVIAAIQSPTADSTHQIPVPLVNGMTFAGDHQILVPSKRKHAEPESENNVKRRTCQQPQPKTEANSSDPAFKAWEDKCRQLRRDFCANLAAEDSKIRSPQLDTAPAADDSSSASSKERQVSSQRSVYAIQHPLSTPLTRVSDFNVAVKFSEKHVHGRGGSLELQGAPEEPYDLFHRFEATYPHYRGEKRHFDKACALLQRLGDAAPHSSLWDDFVFRYYNDYIQEHLPEIQQLGKKAIAYEDYYRNFVEEPQFLSKVIKRTKIQLLSDRTSVLRSDSHGRAAATKIEAPNASSNRSMDVQESINDVMKSVQLQSTHLSKAEDTKVDLGSETKPASTPPQGVNHSQDSSVKLWLERASGAESPELGTAETARELAEIPTMNIDAPESSPGQLPQPQPQPRHQEEDPVADMAAIVHGIAKRNGGKSSTRRTPDTPFSKLSKEFADLDRRRRVVNPEVQRVVDIFTWRK